MNNEVVSKPLCIGLGTGCVLAGTFLSAYTGLGGLPCVARTLFHLPCPGCGLTRSLTALWQADIVSSFRYHPLGLPLFLFCSIFLLGALCPSSWSRLQIPLGQLSRVLLQNSVLAGLLVLLVAIWLIRVVLAFTGNRFFLW